MEECGEVSFDPRCSAVGGSSADGNMTASSLSQRTSWLAEQPLVSGEGSGLLVCANRSAENLLLPRNRTVGLHLSLLVNEHRRYLKGTSFSCFDVLISNVINVGVINVTCRWSFRICVKRMAIGCRYKSKTETIVDTEGHVLCHEGFPIKSSDITHFLLEWGFYPLIVSLQGIIQE
jgi:hypothetical protein